MLNQHSHTVIPESDHLRIGECVLDLPRREIASPHTEAPMRITVKSLQVLMVLVAQQGKVVSREALIEWVWADTMPSDDVLTQAITQLRKAFGDDRGAPKYVETIAKGGYRLLAPVEWIQPPEAVVEAPAPQPAPPASPAIPRPRVGWYLLAAVVVLALAGFGYRMLRDRPSPAPVAAKSPAPAAGATLEYQRITSAPGSEMWPSLSPDGSQVVYSAYSGPDSASLMVQTTAPVPGRPLTDPGKGVQDTMPSWSPDGREIAFARVGPKEACSLLVIPASGGEARSVSACRPGWMGSFSWHPDGRHLITSLTGTGQNLDGALYTIDLGTGAWSRLPYEKHPKDTDLTPAYSPDGRWIAFHRNVSMSDLWRVPAQGGKPERLTDLGSNINSVAWTPDGKSIVFGAYLEAGLSLARLDLQTREVHELGLPNTLAASVAANAPSTAFVIVQPHSRVFSLDLASEGEAVPVFPSTGVDLLPAVAPDHDQLAFVSDRSATDGLWWARIARPESLRLIERLVPVPRYAPAWSPDSTRMLVIGRTDTDKGLYEVTPQSGSVQWLPVPSGKPVYAEYMPDPTRILVVANREAGRLDVTLYDRTTHPWKALASHDDVAMAKVDALRQRILITRPSEDGLWEADLALGNIKRIHDRPGFGGGRRLIPTQAGLWLAAAGEGCGFRLIEISGPTEQPGRCLHREPIDLTGVSFDEQHQRLYFSAEQGDSSDIGWARLPESSQQ